MSDIRIKISSSDEEFSSLNEIFDSDILHSGDTVTFLTDVILGKTVTITKKCNIDLNEHFLFVPISPGIIVKNGAQVNINNGHIQTMTDEHSEDALISQGSKTMITLGSSLLMSTRGTSVHVKKRGGVTIDGASVKARGKQPTIYVEDLDSSLTINSGVVASYEKSAISARSQGSVQINGGEIYTESNGLVPENTFPAIVVRGQNSRLHVSGGHIFSEHTPAVSVEQSAELIVDDGAIYTHSTDYQAVEIDDTRSSLIMNSGWIYSLYTSAIMSSGIEFGDIQHILISGGKVGGDPAVFHVAGSGDHGITVAGGAVKGELPQNYISPGYVVSDVKDEDGYAEIILKTWVGSSDKSVDFPTDSSDVDIFDNPFIAVQDSDLSDATTLFTSENEENTVENEPPTILPPIDFLNPPEAATVVLPSTPATTLLPGSDIIPLEHGHRHNHGPRPQPGPMPGPEPGPDQKEAETFIYNSSVNIRKRIYIYRTPSRKTVISEWRGALRIYDGGYYSPEGEEFAVVKFRVPGSGITVTGYAPVYDLSHP